MEKGTRFQKTKLHDGGKYIYKGRIRRQIGNSTGEERAPILTSQLNITGVRKTSFFIQPRLCFKRKAFT